MTWDWSSPVALGIFAVLAGFALCLLASAVAIASGKAKVSDLPGIRLFK